MSSPGLSARRFKRFAMVFVVTALAGVNPASARLVAPEGSGAGKVDDPKGVAVDQGTGVLYVADRNNFRIDEFTRSGVFLRAFGLGVRDGANKPEVCTAETTCLQGTRGEAEGQQAGAITPIGLAVNSTSHDVYVSEPGFHRVQEFTELGAFVRMFGEGVDKGPLNPGNVCPASFVKECGAGMSSTEPGAFGVDGTTPLALPLYIDSSGNVWVGDMNRLEKFSATGIFVEELPLSGAGRLESVGLDTLGDFFVLESNGEAVRKLDTKGAELFGVDGPPGDPRALTLGGESKLYVGDENSPYHLAQFGTTSGEEEEVFGAGDIIGTPGHKVAPTGGAGNPLAVDETTGTIYVASTESHPHSAVTALTPPRPGPLQRGLGVEQVRGTRAALTAMLNPEGAETGYEFQYVDDATYKADKAKGEGHEFDHASLSPEVKLAASFVETPISTDVSGLKSETTYHFRVVAQNARGDVQTAEGASEAEVFTTTPAVEIGAVYVTGVTTDSATLNAAMNPEGVPSSFHFEYLPAGAYQANIEAGADPFAGAIAAPVPDGSLGGGEATVSVNQRVSGLAPGRTYEYRVVGRNSGGVGRSTAKAFAVWAGEEARLPDGREWELVSPLEKNGGLFERIGEQGITQAAQAGGSITYLASRPTEESPQGYLVKEQVRSERTPAGWVSRDLSLPHESAAGVSIGVGEEYRFFSDDLSRAIAQPFGEFDRAVSEEASEETPLLRDTAAGGGFQPLVIGCPPPGEECGAAVESHANVPPGTRFGVDASTLEPCVRGICGVQFVGASTNTEHVILESPVVGLTGVSGDRGGLYEWSEGHLALVSMLPSNVPATFSGLSAVPSLGRRNASAVGAVNSDGTRVDWAFNRHIYQRNLAIGKTIEIDAPGAGAGVQPANTQPEFQAASADGKVVFFTDEQKLLKEASPGVGAPDLYRCEIVEGAGVPKCALSDVMPGADIQGALLGSSTDGSHVYFVADGAGPAGAKPGGCENGTEFVPNVECNLYEWHEGTVRLVAELAGVDVPDWRSEASRQTARVSPNGQWLEFMSERPLTGYENIDAHSGKPDEEVFLYDSVSGKVACVSCSPSGQRPAGVEYGENATLSGGDRIWQTTSWIAANVPSWTSYKSGATRYQSRYLSDSGRLFFDSHDALAATDTNSAEDVYEFEPAMVGGCENTLASYVPADGGCVRLISSGTSRDESAFLDASESGNDVFFLTSAGLARADEDESLDIYDAHVCQPSDPCRATAPVTAEECGGEQCQPLVAGPAEPTIASLLVSGLGNLTPLPEPVTSPKPTPAQHLARALKACRKKRPSKARRRCEAHARRAYRVAIKHLRHTRRTP